MIVRPGPTSVIARYRQCIDTVSVSHQRSYQQSHPSFTLAFRCIPYLDGTIPRCRVNQTLSTPFHRFNTVQMSRQRRLASSRPCIPNLRQGILGRCHHSFALSIRGGMHRLPCHTRNPLTMCLDHTQCLTTLAWIPEYQMATLISTCKLDPIRTPSRAQHVIFVTSAGVAWGGGAHVPEADGGVATTRGEVFAVGGVGDVEDGFGVAG
mmetsp:Transcript_24455/g.43832  ORF Transcript_24455/g.43832 Transcript_24455/m.43832 type:complete len:208 (+) Transcript_24455:577-1200(+)